MLRLGAFTVKWITNVDEIMSKIMKIGKLARLGGLAFSNRRRYF